MEKDNLDSNIRPATRRDFKEFVQEFEDFEVGEIYRINSVDVGLGMLSPFGPVRVPRTLICKYTGHTHTLGSHGGLMKYYPIMEFEVLLGSNYNYAKKIRYNIWTNDHIPLAIKL